MDITELLETLEEMGADTREAMIAALKDGALLGRLRPADMTEADF